MNSASPTAAAANAWWERIVDHQATIKFERLMLERNLPRARVALVGAITHSEDPAEREWLATMLADCDRTAP